MNPPEQPTPRTDAAWAKSFSSEKPGFYLRDECAKIECELTRLRAELLIAEKWVEHHSQHADDLISENVRLRAENERLTGWLADPQRLHAHCVRTLTEGQISHLFGESMTAIVNRAERTEAECLEQARLLGMSGEREADLLGKLERIERELAAIKHGHGELGKYEQLRLKNAELYDIINRASTQFFHDGTDGEIATNMIVILNEAK